MRDGSGGGTGLTNGSDTDEDKLTPLIDQSYLDYKTYGDKMSRNKEGLKDVNERTRLCGDDDSMGSRTSVVTNTSEKALDDHTRGSRGSTPPRQPPPVRKVIPKPFRRQKQSFDYGDLPFETRRLNSEGEKGSFDSDDKTVESKDEDAKPIGDNCGEKGNAASSKDLNIVNNGSVKVVDNAPVSGSPGPPAQRRRLGAGSGSRDRTKYIYMGDSMDANGRQYSKGMYKLQYYFIFPDVKLNYIDKKNSWVFPKCFHSEFSDKNICHCIKRAPTYHLLC